jgi:uridine kinase
MLESIDSSKIGSIPVDNFCKIKSPLQYKNYADWEQPQALRFDKLIECIDNLKGQKPAYMPSVWCTEVFDKLVEPKEIMLVDGFLIYTNDELINQLDKKIFIDVSDEIIFRRRLTRKSNFSSVGYLREVILPASKKYEPLQKSRADKIFDGNKSINEVFKRVKEYLNI